MALSKTTRDHDEIRRWAEERGAAPSEVASTERSDETGILRFQFPDAPNRKDEKLKEISWDAFFEKFDENDLELLYQEETADGETSNFNKLIHPTDKEYSGKRSSSSHSSSSRKSSTSSSRKSSSPKKHAA
jgi:hypothetical protein